MRPRHGAAPMRAPLWALLLSALLLLGGCAAMDAQNPGTALQPVNAQPLTGGGRLMLEGTDLVAYFTQGRAVPGMAQHTRVRDGVSFRFASAEHLALFDADPQRYLPQYGGYCANGIAYGIPWGGSPGTWRVHEGRLYIFGGVLSQAAFELDLPRQTALADRYWRDEIAGRNSFVRRSWRLLWRVPHYQTEAELAQAVAAARAASAAR